MASERRAQIVASAIATIAELGFNRASFAQIAKHAGISSTRLISYHFEDKAELIRAVVESVLTEAAAYMRPRLPLEGTKAAILAAYLKSNVDFIHEHPDHIRAVIDIAANARAEDGTPLTDPATADGGLKLLVELLLAGQADGEFRAFDPLVMAVTIRAAIDAAAGRITSLAKPDVDAYAQQLQDLFDRATRKDPS